MLPVLLNFKLLKIYTFGLFLLLAFFWGAFLLWKNFRMTSYKEEDVFDGVFVGLAGGLFVSRVVHVILNFDKFGLDPLKFLLINGYPGLSLYGFIGGALLSLYFYFLSKRVRFADAMNYFVPAIFLALGFGKLGAFFSGVEVGGKTKFLLSIKYLGADGFRHLTPFYESILFFLGAFLSYRIMFESRRNKYSHNFNFLFFIWYFSAIYFFLDFLKDRRVILPFNQSFNSIISLVLLLTFSFYFLYYFRSQILGVLNFKHLFKHVKKTSEKLHSGSSKKTGK